MREHSFTQGMSYLVLAQIMVAINIVVSKLLLSSIPIFLLMLIRFSLAALVLLPLHWSTSARKVSIRQHLITLKQRDWGFIFAQALCAGLLFNCLMLVGLSRTDANVAGIITSALPAIIALMSWLVLDEKISAQKAFCVLFASIGLFIIAYDKLNGVSDSHSFLGDFIVLLSLVPEAIYYILSKIYPNRLPIFLIASLLNAINAILLLPVLGLTDFSALHIHLIDWVILFIIGLSSAFFYVFWFMGAQKVDGMMASLSTASMPVATVIFAWIILGEQLTLIEFSGMALVILSIVLYAK